MSDIVALRAAVAARAPVDQRESESIARFMAETERLTDPFNEHADPIHVTASAIVVGPRGTVLHLHKRLGLWLQPGGHIEQRPDGGWETPWEGALREAQEETGLHAHFGADTPVLAHIDVHPGPKGHTHLDTRYVVYADGDPAPVVGESREVHWFAWDEAIALADPGLSGALRALRPA